MRHCPLLTSLIIGCLLLFTVGCSTYVIEEETPEPEEENNKGENNADGGEKEDFIASDTIFTTSDLPIDESLWGNQFFVWKTTSKTPNEVQATLITLDEYYDITENAIATMESLNIDGIHHWRFFTEDEAKAFRNQYMGSNIYDLNAWLLKAGFSPFKHDSGQRYLCADGTKSFAFYSNTISKAGQKKKYYYRGVKTVVVMAASQR